MKAVIYGCKSSPDDKHSVADQHRLVVEAIEREGGHEVIGEPFGEANTSGFRGERGLQLEAAMCTAIEAATQDGEAELWVWHSSRLARGDGTKGRRSIQLIVAQLLYENVTVRSVADPEMVTPMLAGIASKVSNQYAEDLSAHTRRGLAKRMAAGKPVGALPCGYMPEPKIGADGEPVTDARGKVVTTGERVIDPEHEPTVTRMFDLAEHRSTPGEVSRALNAEGHTTSRDKAWTTRAVRDVLRNRDYVGDENGYPQVIEPEQFEAVQRWLDESKRTWGSAPGRPPASDFPLAGIAVCSHCGAAMRSRRCSTTGRRTYRCSNAMEGRNLCPESVPVPAHAAEATFVRMIPYEADRLDAILTEQVGDRHRAQSERKAALTRLEAQLRQLDGTRDKLLADYRRQIEDGRSTAYLVLEQVERIDGERAGAEEALRDAEAVIEEHADQPDVDEVRELYLRLFAFAREQVEEASTLAELGAVARRLVERVRLGTIAGQQVVQATLRVVDNPQLTFV